MLLTGGALASTASAAEDADIKDSGTVQAGTVAAGLPDVYWLDMDGFDLGAGKSQTRRADLGAGYALKYKVSVADNSQRKVYATGVPSWPKATFGNYGYSDFGESKPVLYQEKLEDTDENDKLTDSTITLSDFQLQRKNTQGLYQDVAEEPEYSLILADGESTNQGEKMSYTATGASVEEWESIGIDKPGKNVKPCKSSSIAGGYECVGDPESTGTIEKVLLYKADNPDSVTVKMEASSSTSIQGAIFGLLIANATVTVDVTEQVPGVSLPIATVTDPNAKVTESANFSGNSSTATLPLLIPVKNQSATVRPTITLPGGEWSKWYYVQCKVEGSNHENTTSCNDDSASVAALADGQSDPASSGGYSYSEELTNRETVHVTYTLTPYTVELPVSKTLVAEEGVPEEQENNKTYGFDFEATTTDTDKVKTASEDGTLPIKKTISGVKANSEENKGYFEKLYVQKDVENLSFQVKENAGSESSIEYSTEEMTLTVSTKGQTPQNDVATIPAEITSNVKVAAFTNKLKPNTVTITPQVQKKVEGAASDQSFTFQLAPTGNTDATGILYNDGKLSATVGAGIKAGELSEAVVFTGKKNGESYTGLTFTKEGTYTFTVSENDPGDKWKNETGEQTLTVTVEKGTDGLKIGSVLINGQALGFDQDSSKPTFTFVNRYQSDPATRTLTGWKSVDGRVFQKGETYRFHVTGTASAAQGSTIETVPMPKEVDAAGDLEFQAEGDETSAQKLDFGSIEFTQAGTYTYTISEYTDAEYGNGSNGMTYDKTQYKVVYEVKLNDDGKLEAAVSSITRIDENGTEQNVTTADKPVSFVNKYHASGEVGLKGRKVLQGGDIKDYDGHFTFNVHPLTIKDNKALGTVVVSGKNDVNGDIEFEKPLEFTTEQIAQAVKDGYAESSPVAENENAVQAWVLHYRAVEEISPVDADSVEAVAGTRDFKVRVTDNGKGVLTASVDWPDEDGNELKFINKIDDSDVPTVPSKSVSATISGTKVLENGTLKGGEFQFKLETNDKPTQSAIAAGMIKMPKDGATNDYAGKFSFGDIVFTAPSQGDGWKFDVVEVNGGTIDSETGLKYDNTEYQVVIKVDKDANGNLKTPVVTVYKDGNKVENNEIKFINSYPDPVTVDTGDWLKVTKSLTGDQTTLPFKFVLKDAEGNSVADTGDVQVSTGKDVTVQFAGDLSFAKPGKYEYTLSEVNGGSTLNGVTYDGNTYRVIFEVEYDAKADKLAVSHVIVFDKENEEVAVPVVFSNSYQKPLVPPTSLTVNLDPGRKYLEGRDLKAGEFTFVLKKESGEEVQTAVNSVDKSDPHYGSFAFKGLTFTKPGTYKYTISEIRGNDSTIAYDGTVYNVTINVHDIATGSYEVSITGGKGKTVEFNNTYTPDPTPTPKPDPDPDEPDQPEEPEEPDTPDTPEEPTEPDDKPGDNGDNGKDDSASQDPNQPSLPRTGAAVASAAGAVVLLAAAGIALTLERRRKNQR